MSTSTSTKEPAEHMRALRAKRRRRLARLMVSGRRHPDIFTPEEAAAFLTCDKIKTLEYLEDKHGLISFKLGKAKRYYRRDLVRVAHAIFGDNDANQQPSSIRLKCDVERLQ